MDEERRVYRCPECLWPRCVCGLCLNCGECLGHAEHESDTEEPEPEECE